MRKIVLPAILVAFLVAVIFAGAVSAEVISLGFQEFNIPDGFDEDESSSQEIVTLETRTYVEKYENDNGDYVEINVVFNHTGVDPTFIYTVIGDDEVVNGVDVVYDEVLNKITYVNDTAIVTMTGSSKSVMEEFIM
jgi:hypothetical protein